MAKANLCFNRIGNDGYKMARREDGKWFIQYASEVKLALNLK